MPGLAELKAFNIERATTSLWMFKKSISPDRSLRLTGRLVESTDGLDGAIKSSVSAEIDRITELQDYSILAQTNEGSALSISTNETHADIIVEQTGDAVNGKKVTDERHIKNAAFYVIKLVADDKVLHAVKKTDGSWQTKKARDIVSVVFTGERLDIADKTSFNISHFVDFFILGAELFIAHKTHFESIVNYKEAHVEDFENLQQEPEFMVVFENIEALKEYVGNSKIQLRRASAIRQKGHYKNATFMTNLKNNYAEYGLNIVFNDEGKIVPSEETCRDIFQALLDHRLLSAFSQNIYDVQDADTVRV